MPLLSSYVPTSHVLPLYSTDPPSFHWNVSPFFSAWSAWDSSAVSAFFPNGDKTIGRGVLVFGEGELDPVGVLAGGVAYADALGHLDLKPDKVGLLGDGDLFLALALGGAAAARCAPAAADKGKRGKEGDAKGEDR